MRQAVEIREKGRVRMRENTSGMGHYDVSAILQHHSYYAIKVPGTAPTEMKGPHKPKWPASLVYTFPSTLLLSPPFNSGYLILPPGLRQDGKYLGGRTNVTNFLAGQQHGWVSLCPHQVWVHDYNWGSKVNSRAGALTLLTVGRRCGSTFCRGRSQPISTLRRWLPSQCHSTMDGPS
jgi:hypothetical protein